MPSAAFRRVFAPVALLAAVHGPVLTAALPALGQTSQTRQTSPTSQTSPANAPASAASAASAAAQDSLKLAHQQYEDLHYEDSIQTLTGALGGNNTKAQKIEIYQLLILDLVTLSRLPAADGWVRQLLVLEPTYEMPVTESPRFRDFFAAAKKKWETEGRPGLVKPSEAPLAPIALQHNSPSQVSPSTQVSLSVRVVDPQHRVTVVKLYFRSSGAESFEESAVPVDATGAARASIPPSFVKPPFVEYYFAAYDKAGTQIGSRGDEGEPVRVAVPEPSSGGWILPVAIGGGILGAAAIVVGSLALAGVFKSAAKPAPTSTVSISIGE